MAILVHHPLAILLWGAVAAFYALYTWRLARVAWPRTQAPIAAPATKTVTALDDRRAAVQNGHAGRPRPRATRTRNPAAASSSGSPTR